jgi:hypothetical protein
MTSNVLIALISTNCLTAFLALFLGFIVGAIGMGTHHHNALRKNGYMMTKDNRLYPLAMFNRTGRGTGRTGNQTKQEQEVNDEQEND